ncbi:MAG: VIT1/CCC1 transporter family protein [Crocinitomicaceae bacterium]|nr:VIT1/CCC1 transporter family protein [Crocinitomicaceae bacterium]
MDAEEKKKSNAELIAKYDLLFDDKTPLSKGTSTFIAFFAIGLIPLIIYVVDFIQPLNINLFLISTILTGIGFIVVGYLKSYINETSLTRGIIGTLLLGVLAALVAYYVGDLLERLITG